ARLHLLNCDQLAPKVAIYPRVTRHARRGDRPLPPRAAPSQQLLRNKKSLRFNRAAQNGSRTPLKMLSLLQCASHCPAAKAVGFPPPSACTVSPWRKQTLRPPSRSMQTGGSIIPAQAPM